ncbi:hypothetical protein OHU45_37220 [Streptomyces tubercidicus]|uniref:hypothetical protein n=1 Tax=Streptomyces tubercidicus TaxID=47759 RepID=UPI0030E50D36
MPPNGPRTGTRTRPPTRSFSWPCAPGTRPIANERGYDYLGQKLAGQGFIVVSVRANGINAASVSDDENASACP